VNDGGQLVTSNHRLDNFVHTAEIAPAIMSKLDVSQATIIYVLGFRPPYGRASNQLITILHALDIMFDKHGEIRYNGSNCNAVLAVEGWATGSLKDFFFDESSFATQLENTVPIIDRSRIQDLLPGVQEIELDSKPTYVYTREHLNTVSPELIKRRRKLLVGHLFRSHVSGNHFWDYQRLQVHLQGMAAKDDKLKPGSYVAVHSRSLEGSCHQRLGENLPHDECDMNPDYIRRILKKLSLTGTVAIVVIADGQNRETLDRLKGDPDIGHLVIVPALDVPGIMFSKNPANDMMIAVQGDAFCWNAYQLHDCIHWFDSRYDGQGPTNTFHLRGRGSERLHRMYLLLQRNTELCFCGSNALYS